MENDAFTRRLSTVTHTELIRAHNRAHIRLSERLDQAEKELNSTGSDDQSDLRQRLSETEKELQFYKYCMLNK
jgi:small-conductance mechanosensitive channel